MSEASIEVSGLRKRFGPVVALDGMSFTVTPGQVMDPEGIVWMRGFLESPPARGRAVLVSSHLMSELQGTAGHLVVVGRGKVVADTSVAELIAAVIGDRVTVRTTARSEAMTALARAGATVAAADPATLTVSGLPAERIVALLGQSGVLFSEVSAHRATLEEAYLELTRDAAEFRAASAKEAAR